MKLSSSKAVKFGKMGFHTYGFDWNPHGHFYPTELLGLQVESNSISIRGISEFIFQKSSDYFLPPD